ncbi:MAG: hypothetical protein Q4F72_06455, partial [Desulfovibrionaceae bacterium]|nr:hypothetical protein [Desulfovibrionaceae bacterium]
MQTKGAITGLVSRYRAVLKHCRLLDGLACLALAGALTASAGAVRAAELAFTENTSHTASAETTNTGRFAANYSDFASASEFAFTGAGGAELTISSYYAYGGNYTAGELGGVIYSETGDITFSKSGGSSENTVITLDSNKARTSGGALAIVRDSSSTAEPGTITIGSGVTVSFTNNQAGYGNSEGDGGAIFTRGTLEILGTANFTNNSSAGNGGAMNITGDSRSSSTSSLGNMYVRDGAVVTFEGNTAGKTGGAFRHDTRGEIVFEKGSTATFRNNSAKQEGGAISNFDAASSLTFAGMAYFEGNTSGTNGGAIYNSGSLTLGGTTTFSGNSAVKGGAIYNAETLNVTGLVTLEEETDDVWNTGTMSVTGGRILGEAAGLVSSGAVTVSENSQIGFASVTLDGGSLSLSDSFAYVADAGTLATSSGTISVGERSVLMLGDFEGLSQALAKQDVETEDVTGTSNAAHALYLVDDVSVLALDSKVSLGSVGLSLGSSAQAAADSVVFDSDSCLVVDRSALDDPVSSVDGLSSQTAALTSAGTISVAEGSSLSVTNIDASGYYSIARGDTSGGTSVSLAADSWDTNLVCTASSLLTVTGAEVGATDDTIYLNITVVQESIDGGTITPDTPADRRVSRSRMDAGLAGLVDNAIGAGFTDGDSAGFGERFVNRAIDNLSSREKSRRTIEGAARQATLAGVPQQLLSLGQESARIAAARTAFHGLTYPQGQVSAPDADGGVATTGLAGGDEYRKGIALWISPL